MEKRELICINCPLGCPLTVMLEGGEVVSVSGNTCPRGEAYARKEVTNPTRIVTSTVMVEGGKAAMVSVKTKEDIPKDKIFDAQSKVIRVIAAKGHCVIVGRCADQILKDRTDCLNVFLHAPLTNRIKRVMSKKNLTEKEAKNLILKEERRRADNYHYYTRQIWGASANYHLSLDTSLGYDYVMDVILETAKRLK